MTTRARQRRSVYRTSNTAAQKWPETTAEFNALPASKTQKAASDSRKTHAQLAENIQTIQTQNSQRLLQAHRASSLQSRDNLLNSPYLALAGQTAPTAPNAAAPNAAASKNAKPFIMPFVGTPKENKDIISTFKAVADFAASPAASAASPAAIPGYAGLAAAVSEKRPALPDDIDWNKGTNATLPPVTLAMNQLMYPQLKVNPFVNTPLVNGSVKGYTGNNTPAPDTGSDTQGNTILDGLQVALDVAGLVPGFGELADGLNALISLLRGNYADAALSAAAMIPFAGWGATAGKAAKYALKATDAFGTAAKHADEFVDAGQALFKNADVFDTIAEGAGDYSSLLKKANNIDVSTTTHQAVFYSGAGNRAQAEAFAELNGKTTLELTPGGKYFESIKLFDPGSPVTEDQALEIWKILSERYAKSASGNVYGFVRGSKPGSIFNTVEYQALQKNPYITNIFTELF